MRLDTLLAPSSLPAFLASAWRAWTIVECTTVVAATLKQCHLDCTGDTTVDLEVEAAASGGTINVWDTQRLVGPTEPASELNATYPYAKAGFPLQYSSFCQLGCSFFFSGSPQNTSCSRLCDNFYARNVSVGINDLAEKVRSVPACYRVIRARLLSAIPAFLY